jgi:hypothetical protein
VQREQQAAVRQALSGLRQIPFRFENEGSKIVFYNPTTLDPESYDNEFEVRSGL